MNKIIRFKITENDLHSVIEELEHLIPHLMEKAGDGAFAGPQEIAGMVAEEAQVLTLTTKNYQKTGDTKAVRERCLKFAYALLFAAASLD